MKQSMYKSYDELPLFLNAETTAKLLGISISGMYELMHEKGFPALPHTKYLRCRICGGDAAVRCRKRRNRP